jgi:hypothetical protein
VFVSDGEVGADGVRDHGTTAILIGTVSILPYRLINSSSYRFNEPRPAPASGPLQLADPAFYERISAAVPPLVHALTLDLSAEMHFRR